jgi:hypothetical protein
MAIPAEASDLSVARTEFCEAIGALGIAQHRVAQLFGVGPRSVRRWQNGDRRVPCGVGIVLRLLAAGTVTVAQAEQAARTNGSAKPGAPAADVCRWPCGDPARPDFHFCGSPVASGPYCDAPLRVAPAPEQPVVAPAALGQAQTSKNGLHRLPRAAKPAPYVFSE